MRIYLAARYSRRLELCEYRAALTALGHEVVGRWLEGGHEVIKEQRDEDATRERARFASEDWDDLMSAQVCISFTEEPRTKPGRGGRHVEFGAALADGKICFVIGPAENVFHCLPDITRFETWDEFLRSSWMALNVQEA